MDYTQQAKTIFVKIFCNTKKRCKPRLQRSDNAFKKYLFLGIAAFLYLCYFCKINIAAMRIHNIYIVRAQIGSFNKSHRSITKRCDFFMNKTELGSLFKVFIGVCRH